MRVPPWMLLSAALAAACGPATDVREYELTGVVMALDDARGRVRISHDAIAGFMPAMTMEFPVNDPALLDGRTPGDVVTATLVIEEEDGVITTYYLSTLVRTGHVEIEQAPPVSFGPDIVVPGEIVPDAPLVDERGAPLPLSSLRGRRVALTFIYTRCPFAEFCPLMDRRFAALQRAVAADPALAGVRLVSVTLDPEYDTPPVLRAHAERLGADPGVWSFATGAPDAVAAFSARLGVHTERDGPEPHDLVHNLRTAIIDADGRIASVRSGNDWTPDEIAAELAGLAAARRGP